MPHAEDGMAAELGRLNLSESGFLGLRDFKDALRLTTNVSELRCSGLTDRLNTHD